MAPIPKPEFLEASEVSYSVTKTQTFPAKVGKAGIEMSLQFQ